MWKSGLPRSSDKSNCLSFRIMDFWILLPDWAFLSKTTEEFVAGSPALLWNFGWELSNCFLFNNSAWILLIFDLNELFSKNWVLTFSESVWLILKFEGMKFLVLLLSIWKRNKPKLFTSNSSLSESSDTDLWLLICTVLLSFLIWLYIFQIFYFLLFLALLNWLV